MFLAHGLHLVTQWDFISEVKIRESGYKHAPTTMLSLTFGIWAEPNNIQTITAVAASRVSFSIIYDDQECPAHIYGTNIL